MNADDLQFSLLVFFKTLMETKSLTQSAELLKLSQAKASRNLTKLRLIFQDPLFIRTRHGMLPTSKAEELYPSLISMLNKFEKLFFPEENDVANFSGIIKIGAFDNGIYLFISKVVNDILRQAPNLRLEISPIAYDVYEKIESGSLHFAIYPDVPLPPDFHESVLCEDHFVCVVHKNHPLAHYAKINKIPPTEEINRYPKLEIVVRGYKNNAVKASIYPDSHQKTQISTPYFLSTPSLLEDSPLTLIINYQTAKALTQTSPIVILPTPKPYKTYEARLIWHHRTHKTPLLEWFRKILLEKSQELYAK